MLTSKQNLSSLPSTGYLRQPAVLSIVPISASTLWRLVRQNKFPRPTKLSSRVTAWRAEDVYSWIESRQDLNSAA
jgi:prophage regulatory protein